MGFLVLQIVGVTIAPAGEAMLALTNSSITNTSTQQITDTGNNPAPHQAARMPTASAAAPEMGVWVASMMAGKVMTASVT